MEGGGIGCIDGTERWQKQTERNRCTIVTANGTQCLTVPVTVPSARCRTDEVLISDHGNWRHVHWNALCSAYGTSPFFEFYADDIKPFYDNRWEKLVDYNRDITLKMLHLIGLDDVISAQSANAGALTANAGAPAKGHTTKPEILPDLSAKARFHRRNVNPGPALQRRPGGHKIHIMQQENKQIL